MPASTWLAVGSVLAALASLRAGPLVVAMAATSVGVAAWSARTGGPAPRRLTWLAVGGLAIALRLVVLSPTVAPPATVPDGAGPWRATVESVAAVRDGSQVATLRLDGPAGTRLAATLPRFPAIEPGFVVVVAGPVRPPPVGPYGDYLGRTGIAGTLRSRSLEIVSAPVGPAEALERLRRRAAEALAAAIPEPAAGLAAGIVVGLRDRVDRGLAADFTTVGASHVVAISGWNIAIVAASVAALGGRLARRRRAILTAAAIVAYVLFAGASASVVRAAAMAGVVLIARESGRAGRAAAALGWAALILLLVEPRLVEDAGFQLSTLATAGILAWATPLGRTIARTGRGRLPGWLVECLAVSLAAQAATLPIVLATFGRLAIVSPLVNLAIVPLVAPAMAASGLALLGGWFAIAGGPAGVATVAGLPAWFLLSVVIETVRLAARLPFASASLDPPWHAVAAFGVAVAMLGIAATVGRHGARGRHRSPSPAASLSPTSRPARRGPGRAGRLERTVTVALLAALVGLGVAAGHRPDGTSRITILDVGQGDAILVEGGRGGRMLVDGGPDPDRLLIELDRRLPPWDRRLDVLVLTHPHEDHVAGLALLLSRYRVGRVYEPGMRGPGPGYAAWAAELAGVGAPRRATLATGDRLAVDDVRFRVLWPDPGRVPRVPADTGRAINDVSIVLLGEVDGRRILLTGDVEDDVDPLLLARGLPPVDLLKVAHHGSRTASTGSLLEAIRPAVAVVSAGADNPYGHPARSTLDRLAATGARVLRTDADGSVEVAFGGGRMSVRAAGPRPAATRPEAARPAAGSLTAPGLAAARAGFRVDAAGRRPPAAAPSVLATASAFSCGVPSST